MTLSLGLVTLVVRHYDEAVAFFVDRLGFKVIRDEALEAGKRWVVVAPSGGKGPGLLLARATGSCELAAVGNQTGGRVGFFLMTDDFRRDHAAFEARGVRFRELPRAELYGMVAVFEDLYGNLWDLIEPRTTTYHSEQNSCDEKACSPSAITAPSRGEAETAPSRGV